MVVPSRSVKSERATESARHFVADHDAAHGRRHHDVGRDARGLELRGETRAEVRRDLRVHQHARALQVLRGMETGGEEEVPFEQRALAFEDVENVAHELDYLARAVPLRPRVLWAFSRA